MLRILIINIKKIIYFGFAIYLPKSNSLLGKILMARKIRAFLCKGIVSKCGKNVNIERGARFSSELEIGNNSGLGVNSSIHGKVIIGDDVMMGPNVTIITRNHLFKDLKTPIRLQGHDEIKPVTISHNSWIGCNVIILPGVTISSGTIVGAGSVVTKSSESNSIIAGNPAKTVRKRE